MKALIIDDEIQSHNLLKGLLKRYHPDIEVEGSAFSVAEALQKIEYHLFDLVFLDIQLPDGNAFDLLEKVSDRNFQVIFITGHDQYALTAFRFGALDYLMKPIVEEELENAIYRAKEKMGSGIPKEQYQILLDMLQQFTAKKLPSRLAIPTSEGIHLMLVENIIRFRGAGRYTEVVSVGSQKNILSSKNLGEYAKQFELYSQFVRVHKSHIVNLHFVDTYVKTDGGYLILKSGEKVGLSRVYKEELIKALKEI